MKPATLASLAALALCAGAVAPPPADAQTAPPADTCTLTGGSISLGSLVASPSAQRFPNLVSGVTVTCNAGTAWSLAADQGAHPTSLWCPSSYSRELVGVKWGPVCRASQGFPMSMMPYDIYTDSTFAVVLSPAGTSGGGYITGVGNSKAQAVPLNIEIGPTFGLEAGDYADTVNLTVTYN